MEGNMVLRMKKVRPGAQLPQRQTAGSAGFDLCACIQEPVVLEPGDSALFPTGLAAEIPQGHVGLIFTRSGLGVAQLVILPVCLPELAEVEELSETARGQGGFGSTGR